MFDAPWDLAAGFETQVLYRLRPNSNQWGDLRLQALLGITRMTRPYESRLGYELFLKPGLARYYEESGKAAPLSFALGVEGGLPLRVTGSQPAWRADDLVGTDLYIVPALGANTLGFAAVETQFTLSLRGYFWSAITP